MVRLDLARIETPLEQQRAGAFRASRRAHHAAHEAARVKPSDEIRPATVVVDEPSDGIPRGAAGIAKHARGHGWKVRLVCVAPAQDDSSDGIRSGRGSRDEPSDEAPGGTHGEVESSDEDGSRTATQDEASDETPPGTLRKAPETVSVRCWGVGRWACALYRRQTGRWALSACLVADADGGLRRVKSGELRAYVAAHPRTL